MSITKRKGRKYFEVNCFTSGEFFNAKKAVVEISTEPEETD